MLSNQDMINSLGGYTLKHMATLSSDARVALFGITQELGVLIRQSKRIPGFADQDCEHYEGFVNCFKFLPRVLTEDEADYLIRKI